MPKSLLIMAVISIVISITSQLGLTRAGPACIGFFYQNSLSDQNAERIIFTQNKNRTITTYVHIQDTGSASEFSLILPLPSAISLEHIEVPEDSMTVFTELEVTTEPVFIPPARPQYAQQAMERTFLATYAMAADCNGCRSGSLRQWLRRAL